ncbi:hypothetical protein ALC57_13173 [Trachymyrmex cornetzi]|uniref:Uncharacterized protein n=1 Tax=Trachymyrmex cornetzi TaxID=471704 RepID=A0A151J088_9HYME|nr:hypothetical protein ALC57_13173 [Trachymyrmex cornetzi]
MQLLDYFATGHEVSRVGIWMPEFTPADPELWFSIVDRSFQAEFWRFVVADVSRPIIGADFLAFYDLLVDLRGSCLIDRVTSLTKRGRCVRCETPKVRTVRSNVLTIGPQAINFMETHDEARITNAEHCTTAASKEARAALRAARAEENDAFEEAEGLLYGAGIAD